MHSITKGLLAGAAGTLALDTASYGDMLLRGRAASEVPAQVVGRVADRAGVPLGDGEEKDNRAEAAGALFGYLTGIGAGAAYGLLRHRRAPLPNWVAGPLLGAAVMVGANGPATVLRLTDPTSWDLTSWVSDVVPHLAYGLTAAAAYRALG
ncbi:hypothetical protein [Streptomyces carpinensis]|uniref:DUF1440 domain-containing protein n=1 Tax=Streptomyces carpinensis TaxID=66369 RepID=A0ABV1WJB8_9ACTN|nr:hypothetical protein [Streptomyces carpinensis]